MQNDDSPNDAAFLQKIERLVGRRLSADEVDLATSLRDDKSPEIIARELDAANVTDPKKIRPEPQDTANG